MRRTRLSSLVFIRLFLCLGLVFILLPTFVQAQSPMASYFEKNNVNRDLHNVAFMPKYNFYVGMPALSNYSFSFNNDFFAWNRLFELGDDDSLRVNTGKFVGKLSSKNLFGISLHDDILRGGFRLKDDYLSFGIALDVDAHIMFGKDFLGFLAMGPASSMGKNHFASTTADIMSYAYLYVGYARQLTRNVAVGARLKLINGLITARTSRDIAITWNILNDDMSNPDITPFTYEFNIDGNIGANLPFVDGKLQTDKILGNALGNLGFGIDLGLDIALSQELNFSAAINDIGAIFWNSTASYWKYANEGLSVFNGINPQRLIVDKTYKVQDFFKDIWDSLHFAEEESMAHTTSLPTSFITSADYTLHEHHLFGLAFRGKFMYKYFNFDATINYTYILSQNFAISLNNTFSRSGPINLGFAIYGNAGPVQLLLAIDRINSLRLSAMRTISAQIGVNFVFGKIGFLQHEKDRLLFPRN